MTNCCSGNVKEIPCYNTCFKCRNQALTGCWTPNTRASSAMALMFLIAVLFIPVGIGLLATSDKIKEKVIEYSDHPNCQPCKKYLEERMIWGLPRDCNCTIDIKLETKWSGDVYFLYGLSNFYQNTLSYTRSRDNYQLSGRRLSNTTAGKYCKRDREMNVRNVSGSFKKIFDHFAKPKYRVKDNIGTVYAPCGAIANGMFSDSFQLVSVNYGKVPMTHQGITWKSDRETNFRNPSGSLKKTFQHFAKPKYWLKNVYELDQENDDNNGFQNNDLIVWMRVAAFPTFRKLYRKLLRAGGSGKFANGLPDDAYKLVINYRFPVEGFEGKKIFVMTQSSWMGGKSRVFGIGYVTVGTICLFFGFVFLVFNMYDARLEEASKYPEEEQEETA